MQKLLINANNLLLPAKKYFALIQRYKPSQNMEPPKQLKREKSEFEKDMLQKEQEEKARYAKRLGMYNCMHNFRAVHVHACMSSQ